MKASRSFMLFSLLGVLAVLIFLGRDAEGLRFMALVSLTVSVLAQLLVMRAFGVWSVPSLLTAILSLFHVGLAPFVVLGLTLPVPGSPTQWVYTDQGRHAFWIAGVACASLALGALLIPRREDPDPGQERNQPRDDDERIATGWIGTIVIALSASTWFFICVDRMGIQFAASSYEAYKASTATAPFDYVFLGVSLGMVMLACSSNRTPMRVGLIIFGVFATAGLPLGLRGEVLFPLAAFAAVLGRRVRMPRLRSIVVAGLLILALVANVKALRAVGLGNIQQAQLGATPLAAVAEMGYTLRTVQAQESWHSSRADEREHGVTYVAPVQRILGRIHVLPAPPPSDTDWRLMNIEMRAREGNIGGSVVAEAAHNFGQWGVIFILMLLGLLSSVLQNTRVNLRTDLVLGLAFTVMLQHIRNSFTPVPLQLVIGALLFSTVVVVVRLTRGREAAASSFRYRVTSSRRS